MIDVIIGALGLLFGLIGLYYLFKKMDKEAAKYFIQSDIFLIVWGIISMYHLYIQHADPIRFFVPAFVIGFFIGNLIDDIKIYRGDGVMDHEALLTKTRR